MWTFSSPHLSLDFHAIGTIFTLVATSRFFAFLVCRSFAVLAPQIFRLPRTTLKGLWHLGQSKSPIDSSTFFPDLSGRPAIFQLFLGLATSVLHFGHLAMHLPPIMINYHDLNDIE